MRDLKQLNKDFINTCNTMDKCRDAKKIISCYQCSDRSCCNAFATRNMLHGKIRTLRNEIK
jgi:hypothetical protein